MASETFVTALLIITGIVAAGILITAVYPVVWNMAGTFTSSAHQSDVTMRTDFKIVSTYANDATPSNVRILMVNVGTTAIGTSDIQKSIVNIGNTGNFGAVQYGATGWTYTLLNNDPNKWNPGETLEIDTTSTLISDTYPNVYFQFILPSGVWRSSEFTISKPS